MATAPFWAMRQTFPAVERLGEPAPVAELREARLLATAGKVEAEAVGVEQMERFLRHWTDLVGRAVEPNGFLEPGFALSAARHFPAKARPLFVLVWKRGRTALDSRLIALFPIVTPGFAIGAATARGWLHKQAALATPLIDRDHADEAAAALLDWFASNATSVGAVMIPTLPICGAAFGALTRAAAASGRSWRVLDRRERAVLLAGDDPQEAFTRNASPKALSEMRRRRRRLEESGELRLAIYSTPADIPAATENFLALEASGWKATRGALLGHPSLATFTRSAMRLLAREGKCRIHSLELAGRPIAMGIVIESGGRAYFWKIAYDESHRSQAPGVQLVYSLTEGQMARGDVEMTDSCAIPGHLMIERCWPDRLAVCDLMIQARPSAPTQFAAACGQESMRRRLRAAAKRVYHRLLKRKTR